MGKENEVEEMNGCFYRKKLTAEYMHKPQIFQLESLLVIAQRDDFSNFYYRIMPNARHRHKKKTSILILSTHTTQQWVF